MRSHFDLRRKSTKTPKTAQRRLTLIGWWKRLFFLLFFLLLLGGSFWVGRVLIASKLYEPQKISTHGALPTDPLDDPRIKESGPESPNMAIDESDNPADWWTPGRRPPFLGPTDSIKRPLELPPNTQQILHNNWRNPSQSHQPQPSMFQSSNPPPLSLWWKQHPLPHSFKGKLHLSVWLPWWESNKTSTLLTKHATQIDEINPLGYDLTPDGTIHLRKGASLSKRVIQTAHRSKMTIIPVLGNVNSPSMTHTLLKTDKQRKKIVHHITQWVEWNHFDGVEIQFQPLFEKDRDYFCLFIEELAFSLHQHHRSLAVSVHPKTSTPGETAPQRAQDWKRIGKAADHVKIMAWNYSWGEPGPSAPSNWLEHVLTLAEQEIPDKKITISLSAQGYYWSKTNRQFPLLYNQLKQWQQAGAHPLQTKHGEDPCYRLVKSSTPFTGCVPDSLSIHSKLQLILHDHPHIHRWSLWYLGAEDPNVWPLLAKDP
ncbi:glycosyl hydrolase family 18 protein [Marininema halotolerans]|uniref:Spore germination protein YaaH n=1 Tax=Marininema halotolerans TaxID=1155944 RepID=A0A1I6Q3X7_9BACL|nr:glycosyl hydrolase family 18 protein [Marininema halotolerans]SFS47133.1 Spore germination protein YaaH [Marininema halotolerans]